MVAIIGARGSGKTAIADLIAHAGSSRFPLEGDRSFLNRAKPLLGGSSVVADWSDGNQTDCKLLERPSGLADVHYLTQQFVDRLCSSVEESDELIEEIKRVVFLAHEPSERLGASDISLGDARSSENHLAARSAQSATRSPFTRTRGERMDISSAGHR